MWVLETLGVKELFLFPLPTLPLPQLCQLPKSPCSQPGLGRNSFPSPLSLLTYPEGLGIPGH